MFTQCKALEHLTDTHPLVSSTSGQVILMRNPLNLNISELLLINRLQAVDLTLCYVVYLGPGYRKSCNGGKRKYTLAAGDFFFLSIPRK